MMNKIIVSLCLMIGLSGCVNESEKKDLHCAFYNEKYSVEDVISSFEEVVLYAEYSDGDGDYTLVQKWENPIYYKVDGYRLKDMQILEDLFTKLNAIEGFPGIYKYEDNFNLTIDFYNDSDFYTYMGHIAGGNADGAVQYWYDTDLNYIYEGCIGYRNDMDDSIRKSVILEEVINLLGITDTDTREDSITYQYSSTNTELSEMDWIILKILYNDQIEASMNAQTCREIIKKIYY